MSTAPAIIRWDQAYNRNGDGKLPRAVVNVIRTYMNNHTLAGWVSQETLSRNTGLDERTVRRQIEKNVKVGWLTVTKRGRTGQASEYQLTYPRPDTDVRLGTADSNRTQMSGYTQLPDTDVRLEPDTDVRPTTPRTSPQEKFLEGALPGTVPDPLKGSGLYEFGNRKEASPSQPDTDVRLAPNPDDPWSQPPPAKPREPIAWEPTATDNPWASVTP